MPQRPLNGEPDLQPLDTALGSTNNVKGGLFGRFSLAKLASRKKNDAPASDQADQPQDEKRIIPEQLVGPRTVAERRGLVKGVVAGLPRTPTLRRIDSEKRDRLLPTEECLTEKRQRAGPSRRRAYSAMRPVKSRSPVRVPLVRRSAPDQARYMESLQSVLNQDGPRQQSRLGLTIPTNAEKRAGEGDDDLTSPPPPLSPDDGVSDREEAVSEDLNDPEFQKEIELTWILNLTMRFRDGSNREKFIITYAQQPTRWKRVTVSCDYRNAEPESLEANLKTLVYHRDKNAHIYEAIRDSLPEIQYFPTVTNLKLETKDHRLHVHVTEDINEKIDYPPISQIEHLALRPSERFPESVIKFESHLSGFVYKVSVNGRTYIKKEIPSPDTVEEFLYEIDALHRLRDSKYVIKFRGVVVDEKGEFIKGLLIDYATKGSLADIIYDHPDYPLTWARREMWAKQIVQGLANIHDHGFVQGDFTLSNIVVDADDNVKIIDINRRGCPVGWEPPEFLRLIESGRRVSMFIGVKSDLFQMGMCLWGLAELCDEPDREEGDLLFQDPDVPGWFQTIVKTCLSSRPSTRKSANDLLPMFDSSERTRSITVEMGTDRSMVLSSYTGQTNENDQSAPHDEDGAQSTRSQVLEHSPVNLKRPMDGSNAGITPNISALQTGNGVLHSWQDISRPRNELSLEATAAAKRLESGQGEQTPTNLIPPMHQDSGFQDGNPDQDRIRTQDNPGEDFDLGPQPATDNRHRASESDMIATHPDRAAELAGVGGGAQ